MGIVSGVGDDVFGSMILERLRHDGVDLGQVEVFPGRTTGTAFIAYESDGSRSYVFHWAETPAVMASEPPDDVIGDASHFHVMGCSLMPDADFAARIVRTARRARAAGVTVSFDPNIRAELLTGPALGTIVEPMLEVASILLPGASELAQLSGHAGVDDGTADMISRYGFDAVVVKRGAGGARLYTDGSATDVVPYRVDEIDPTGAGDYFDAAFIVGMAEGRDLISAAHDGAAAGALATTGFGPMEGEISRVRIDAMRARD